MRKPVRPPTRLELARRAAGWTKAELATRTGVSPTTLWRAERGIGHPQLPEALRIARVLGTTVEALWGPEAAE